ncbi:MAG: hypothetical protein HDT32_03645 [Clostridiales bacterium]|nr:hypothetical protein [Clostridiales bacterium]
MVQKNFFTYTYEISCEINDFLESNKKCLIIYTKNFKNCNNIFNEIQSDFVFTDVYYNVKNLLHLLFLLRQQKNPKKRAAEYNFFVNAGHVRLNPMGLIKSATNAFREDIKYFEEQIVQQLKELGAQIVVPICYCDEMGNEIFDLIFKLCCRHDINTKFILLCHNDSMLQIKAFASEDFCDSLKIEFTTSILKTKFKNLTIEQLNFIKIATNDDLFEMEKIYEYLNKISALNDETPLIIDELFNNIVAKNYSGDKSLVLSIAAHFKEKFTVDGLEYVYCNSESVDYSNEIINILDTCVEDGILNATNKEYFFIIGLFKKAFSKIYENRNIRFHSTIECYLEMKNPFEYDLRYYHLREIKSSRAGDMLLMKVINALRLKKVIDNDTKTAFEEYFDINLLESLTSIYTLIESGNFKEALFKCSSIDTANNLILHNEVKYLYLFLEWKEISNKNHNLLIHDFEEILSAKCETETKLYTMLLQLSIACNEGNKLDKFPSPSKLFYDIIKILDNYDCIDALFLKNVLYRKSNAALIRVSSLRNVKSSFEYFKDKKELYSNEYFMAGTNLVALLLQSSIKTNAKLPQKSISSLADIRNPYLLAKELKNQLSRNCPPALKVNLENNFLIAKQLFTGTPPTQSNLEKLAGCLDGTGHGCKIMTYMNLGTMYALRKEYERAIYYWNKAEELNDDNDEYYTYIIKNNRIICKKSQNEKVFPDELPSEEIPSVFADKEVIQYIKYRQTILSQLILKENIDYDYIETLFNDEFNSLFHGAQLFFFSQPYFLSDVQFWSDN